MMNVIDQAVANRYAEEAVLECKKCGKRKQVFIDYVSIKEKFH